MHLYFFFESNKETAAYFCGGVKCRTLFSLGFNFGRALKMTRVYAAFPEQTPCCACTVASGRIHTNVLLWA